MPGNFKDEDVRIQKTKEALMEAMSKLLELRDFNKITVNDLCEEAQIGRATFYAHFKDKYDLLKYWLNHSKSKIMLLSDYEDYKKIIDDQVISNLKVIKNLIKNINSETYELLCDFIISLLDINIDKTDNGESGQKHIILFKFCSGGVMNYLMWLGKNNFPEDCPLMNPYFYDILTKMKKLNEEQK